LAETPAPKIWLNQWKMGGVCAHKGGGKGKKERKGKKRRKGFLK
jgi:hypothetical protein